MTRTPSPRHFNQPSDTTDRLVGVVLADRYRVMAKLAQGGMGYVYEAEHLLMRSKVAIKVLNKEMSANAEMVARFKREAQAAASIDHPNICAATDFGQTPQGEFFMVMEYLKGTGLDDALGSMTSLGPYRTVHIAQQICGVLEQAHRLNIVHRDLKPENIMLLNYRNDRDFVKVLDFGVARIRIQGENTRLTRAGVVYGTPAYMSPEQVMGEDIDARADLYALGVMMYEMATGRVPFDATTVPRVMNQHLTQAPTPPSQVIQMPPPLEALILNLMQKRPERRIQTATQLREILLELESNSDPTKWTMPESLRQKQPSQPAATQDVDVVQEALPIIPDPKRNMVKGIIIFAIMAAIAGGMIMFAKKSSESSANNVHDVSSHLASERDLFLSKNKLGALLESMARGEHDKAIEALEATGTTHQQNPHFFYYMGVARIGKKQHNKALNAFARAITLDDRYGQDRRLIEDLVLLSTEPNKETFQGAKTLITTKFKKTALEPLRVQALEHKRRQGRLQAFEILESIDGLKGMKKWRRLNVQLKNAVGCKTHRGILEEMILLNDARNLPLIKEIDRAPKRGCGKRNRSDCYECIREDVAKALKKIKPQESSP